MLKCDVKLDGKKVILKTRFFKKKVRSLEFSFLMHNSKLPT